MIINKHYQKKNMMTSLFTEFHAYILLLLAEIVGSKTILLNHF